MTIREAFRRAGYGVSNIATICLRPNMRPVFDASRPGEYEPTGKQHWCSYTETSPGIGYSERFVDVGRGWWGKRDEVFFIHKDLSQEQAMEFFDQLPEPIQAVIR